MRYTRSSFAIVVLCSIVVYTCLDTIRITRHYTSSSAVPAQQVSDDIQSSDTSLAEHATWQNLVMNNLPSAINPNARKPAWLKIGPCPSTNSTCWDYCMPMKGDMTKERCFAATKYELLHRQPRGGHCHASALHMLLDDVIFAMKLVTLQPLLVAGTLLGAFRNGTIIRWTRDVDLLYNKTAFDGTVDRLAQELEALGYNLFFHEIWRVCINSAHPLASNIFHVDRCATASKSYDGSDVPYLDLYAFTQNICCG